MGVDDELSTPILHSDDDEERNRRTFSDDELDAGGGGLCCNPASACHRFIALILMCLVGFGNDLVVDPQNHLMNSYAYTKWFCIFQLPTFVMTILEHYRTILKET